MREYALPSAAREAVWTGAPTGQLDVTLTVTDASSGSIVLAATPAAETTTPGVYSVPYTTPAVAGLLLETWSDGVVTSSYELEVTATLFVGGSVIGGALCTLADVRGRRQTPANTQVQDAEVQRLITSLSAAIADEYEREFTPTNGETRTFEWDPDEGTVVSLNPYDLRAVTQLIVDPDIAVDVDDYRLGPQPAKHGTYTRIHLRAGAITPDSDWPTQLVHVTGDWGFPAIPENVREAAIVSVVHNMRTTVGQYSVADGAGGESRFERAEIPQAARDLLEPFRRMA